MTIEIDVITTAISTVGFPIVAFLLMYRFARETVKENTEAVRELKNELTRLREAERHDRRQS